MFGSSIEVSAAPAPAGGSAASVYRLQIAGPPTNGVTGVGVVGTGELVFDTTNKVPYINVGDSVTPTYDAFQLNVP